MLTCKFNTFTDPSEKELHLTKLITLLDERITRISVSMKIAPEGVTNNNVEDCYLYDTSVALFTLIATAFKNNASG